jgi:DNA-binding NarL/FixJ family response regulator
MIHIFIIEDDEMTTNVLKTEIKKEFPAHNIAIRAFKTGEQCHLTDQKPDIAIVDYQLNSVYKTAMNGLQIIELFKDKSPDTNMILVTSEENSAVEQKAMHLGVSDYILKNELLFLKLRTALLQCIQLIELKIRLRKQELLTACTFFLLVFILATYLGINCFARV